MCPAHRSRFHTLLLPPPGGGGATRCDPGPGRYLVRLVRPDLAIVADPAGLDTSVPAADPLSPSVPRRIQRGHGPPRTRLRSFSRVSALRSSGGTCVPPSVRVAGSIRFRLPCRVRRAGIMRPGVTSVNPIRSIPQSWFRFPQGGRPPSTRCPQNARGSAGIREGGGETRPSGDERRPGEQGTKRGDQTQGAGRCPDHHRPGGAVCGGQGPRQAHQQELHEEGHLVVGVPIA